MICFIKIKVRVYLIFFQKLNLLTLVSSYFLQLVQSFFIVLVWLKATQLLFTIFILATYLLQLSLGLRQPFNDGGLSLCQLLELVVMVLLSLNNCCVLGFENVLNDVLAVFYSCLQSLNFNHNFLQFPPSLFINCVPLFEVAFEFIQKERFFHL